jgi:hypothetical protein
MNCKMHIKAEQIKIWNVLSLQLKDYELKIPYCVYKNIHKDGIFFFKHYII